MILLRLPATMVRLPVVNVRLKHVREIRQRQLILLVQQTAMKTGGTIRHVTMAMNCAVPARKKLVQITAIQTVALKFGRMSAYISETIRQLVISAHLAQAAVLQPIVSMAVNTCAQIIRPVLTVIRKDHVLIKKPTGHAVAMEISRPIALRAKSIPAVVNRKIDFPVQIAPLSGNNLNRRNGIYGKFLPFFFE